MLFRSNRAAKKKLIATMETQIKSLISRVQELENSDSEPDSENEESQVRTTITTENRFSPLQNDQANDSHQLQEPDQFPQQNSAVVPDRTDDREDRQAEIDSQNQYNKDQRSQKILILSDSMMRRINERRLFQESEITKTEVYHRRIGRNERLY